MSRHRIAALTERMNVLHDAMSLEGKTLLITRQREQSAEFVAEIERRGGAAVVIPMIRISNPESWSECDAALERLATYDAMVFTSTNAVARFFQRLREQNVSVSDLLKSDVYAVGEKTKEEIEKQGVAVKFVPEEFSANTLSEFFKNENAQMKRFLLPKGTLGTQDLATTLTKCGARVDSVDVYTNNPPDEASTRELKERMLKKEFDVVTFASPSAVRNFAGVVSPAMFGQIQNKTKIAVIGPTTKEEALDLEFNVDIEAKKSTAQGLVEAISDFYSNLNPEP